MQRTINAMKELIFESVGEEIFWKQKKQILLFRIWKISQSLIRN